MVKPQCGLKKPTVLCLGVPQFLCLNQVMSFPWDEDYISEPVCACCLFQCAPDVGCAKPFPEGAALLKIQEITKPAQEVMAREIRGDREMLL